MKTLDSQGIAVIRKYEDFAREYGRVFRVFYVNCATEQKLCKNIKIESQPVISIFPPLPAPQLFYSYV